MKKIINAKMYDTDTANYVGCYEADYYQTDFDWYQEHLYQKKNGEFFIEYQRNCRGGCTDVLCNYNEMMRGNHCIIPITEQDARRWVEECLDADAYIKLFGKPQE